MWRAAVLLKTQETIGVTVGSIGRFLTHAAIPSVNWQVATLLTHGNRQSSKRDRNAQPPDQAPTDPAILANIVLFAHPIVDVVALKLG